MKVRSEVKEKLKSPRTAMIYAMVFPGMGQLYNGKKFKAVVVFCAEVGLLTNSIYLNQQYQKSRTTVDREFYINNRNLSTWWLIGTILFSTLDAFVDAHLFNFDESSSLSMDVNPIKGKQQWVVKLLLPISL